MAASTFDAKPLQDALAKQTPPYDPGPIDGVFGVKTQSAMNHWQRDHGLDETYAPVAEVFIGLGIPLPPEMPEQPAPPPAPKASNPITDYLAQLAIKAVLANLTKGLPVFSFLNGYKTYLAGLSAILTGIVDYTGTTIPGSEGFTPLQWVFAGIFALTFRSGLKTVALQVANLFGIDADKLPKLPS